ncbi:MAG: hypothetical protein RIS29_2614 [Bacteroidota bacterium]|jgi:hypothetical protein
MFYYRRKILLALLQKFNGELLSTPLQKYLFLLTRMQKEKAFDFIPYKFGCYSLHANQDLLVLEKLGYVERVQSRHSVLWKLVSTDNFLVLLKPGDLAILNSIHSSFSEYRTNDLIKHTYVNYPFWAINSTILQDVLSEEEQEKVMLQKRHVDSNCLFTIGYEGVSLETYINKLIINDIKVLCDVRKNAYSQKWGFSKSTLQDACEKVGIKYIHIPQLGIESGERQVLNSLADYKRLFTSYEAGTLIENNSSLLKLADIVNSQQRVALTCFEKDVQMCHRGVIASNLMKLELLKTFNRKDL